LSGETETLGLGALVTISVTACGGVWYPSSAFAGAARVSPIVNAKEETASSEERMM